MTWPIVWNESRSVNEEENRFEEAAIEAEFETGYREETREEARRGVVTRLLRMTSGALAFDRRSGARNTQQRCGLGRAVTPDSTKTATQRQRRSVA